jgi:hypothetical protein
MGFLWWFYSDFLWFSMGLMGFHGVFLISWWFNGDFTNKNVDFNFGQWSLKNHRTKWRDFSFPCLITRSG